MLKVIHNLLLFLSSGYYSVNATILQVQYYTDTYLDDM